MNKTLRALGALFRPLPKDGAAAQPAAETLSGNFVKLTGEALGRGECRNVRLHEGALRLRSPGEGAWTSPVFYTQDFNDLVLSWNSDTPDGTWVELLARAYLPREKVWTRWLSWGRWSTRLARASVTGEDTYCYANSVPGAGDSSLNLREGYVGGAFQMRAILHAEEGSECPALRLVAATFKNTADPDWQKACSLSEPEVDEPDAVLLDTPSFSQRMRHPDYGRVICSACSMAMQLCGQGEDLLPEDLTMLCYDHGFGGNGNWSFTTAAAGAFGFESYVHYMSFAGLRQELARGCAVALSVKYSKTPEGKHAYWENAFDDVGGHLIVAVGYAFDASRGEYVYYVNDPFTPSDGESAHRVFPESQLDGAWYRRAAYLVHGRTGDGAAAQTRLFAALRPVAGRPGCWTPVWEGAGRPLPHDFTRDARSCFGHGTVFYTVEGEWSALPDGVRRMTGNLRPHYDGFSITGEGWLQFDDEALAPAFAEGRAVTVHVIANDGRAIMALAEPAAAPYVPGAPSAPVRGAGKLWRWALPVGLAAAAAVAFTRRRKHR